MEALSYEKTALNSGSPFTWSEGEPLSELMKPDRVAQIKADFEKRKERAKKRIPINPLREGLESEYCDIDDLYNLDEGNGACSICTK